MHLDVLKLLLLLQSSAAYRINEVDERSLNELVQKAKETIRRLHDLVHNAIGNAEHFVQEKVALLKAKADEVIAKTEKAIHDEIQKVKQQIEKIKEEAAIIGVDVKECTIEHESELEAIARGLIEQLIQCVKDELDKAVAIVSDAVNEILAIKDELVGLPGQLKSCLGTTSPVKCVTDLISRIVKDITGVPTLIQEKVNEIMELINNIEADLKACAMRKVIQATKEAGLVGVKVAKCVADKITE